MYRIMLVEDEPEVLNGILSTVDWAQYSFMPPVGCRDGREAIAAIENGFSPHVVITDIRMPFVDGLELTRYITERLPRTMVVVLSGHDEFAYAQQALRLGVYDYVLKPVTPGSLTELLKTLKTALDTKRLDDIEESMRILLGYFLNQLIAKPQADDAVTENLRRHQLTFGGQYYLAAVLDVDGSADEAGELMRYALYNIASELIDLPGQAIVFQATDGATKVLFGIGDPEADRAQAEEMLTMVCHTFRQHMPCTASAGIGDIVPRLGDVYLSHRHAQTALEHRFFTGEASVNCFAIRNGEPDIDLAPYYSEFEDALRDFQTARVSAAVSGLFDKLRESHCPLNKCMLCCQRLIVLLHVQFAEYAELERLWEDMDFPSAATIGRLQERMQELCRRAMKLFEPAQTGAAAQLVGRAEAYIREHYADPGLSLQFITEHFAVSVSYFSANFKAGTGNTFLEYLTKMRMNKAKQLLALTDIRAYETAQAVGYSDPHYFSVAFKRYTGMSPKEYREYSAKR